MRIVTIITLAIMFTSINLLSQSSFGLNGYWGLGTNFTTPLYNYESNTSNYSTVRDWGLSLIYGAELANKTNFNLYSISIAKTLGNHNLSVRYSPGYQKEFNFNTGEAFITSDTTSHSLTARYTYKELFGVGYSYKFSEQFSAGFTFRFFNQSFNQEIVTPVFEDTLYLVRQTQNEEINFWKGDFGINYLINERLGLALSSINVLNFGEKSKNSEFQQFEIKREKGVMLVLSYKPFDIASINLVYETIKSVQLNVTGNAGNFGFGATLFQDNYQRPSVRGIIPVVNFRGDLYEVSLSAIKYFTDTQKDHGVTDFIENGISSVINNPYSYDKILLSVSFNINTIKLKTVKLIDVEIVREIYPTFSDNYLDYPFAYGTVVNLSDEFITVKPLAKINGVNEEDIQSPVSDVAPHDTVKVPFYMIIPENYKSEKTLLSSADFYLLTNSDQPDDQFQKAVLVNGINSWDGRVSNLRYFITKDMEFSMTFAKKILSENKSVLDTLPVALENFYKAKTLFNELVQNLVYVSDPRASIEYVQFPNQTVELKGGDCDDLSVCYSSLLESVGMQTTLVDYKENGKERHVNLLFNTGLSPNQAKLITNNDTKYFVRESVDGKDEIWLPVETTSLTDFDTAWEIGSEKFNKEAINELGIARGSVELIDIY